MAAPSEEPSSMMRISKCFGKDVRCSRVEESIDGRRLVFVAGGYDDADV